MKKICVLFMMLFVSTTASTTPREHLQFNNAEIEAELKDIIEIEKFVLKNEGIKFENVKLEKQFKNVKLENALSINLKDRDSPLNIPPFIWGFCLGLIGVLIVFFATENKEQATKSIYGCLVGVAFSLILSLALNS